MKDQKLDDVTWGAYLALSEKYDLLKGQLNEVKHLLKHCAYKEEVQTVKLLKELMGVR